MKLSPAQDSQLRKLIRAIVREELVAVLGADKLKRLRKPGFRPVHDLSVVPMGTLTAADIEAGRSPKGGWTKATLAQWGVPWPPPHGWRKRLVKAA